MPEYAALDIPEDGKLSDNILWFARALRKAGLPIGTGRVIDAVRAVEAAGFTSKSDFFYTLRACFVSAFLSTDASLISRPCLDGWQSVFWICFSLCSARSLICALLVLFRRCGRFQFAFCLVPAYVLMPFTSDNAF